MKKLYMYLFLVAPFILKAQTTINYPQRVANYGAFFTDSGGNFDSGADEFGMWANGGGAKQSVAWRSFTEDGTTTGTPSTMAVGDSFTITVSATQASFGVIGCALLSSPTTTSWADRISNYAVQVNLNGNSGANDPWEVVSSGGTVSPSSIGGSDTYADFKFEFTLTSATTMTVSMNDGAETFNITLNNTDITGYSVYIADDWNGTANANIFWKPTTEYTYATTLSTKNSIANASLKASPNPVKSSFRVNAIVNNLKLYDVSGKLVKTFEGHFSEHNDFDISELNQGLYFAKIETNSGQTSTSKLIKN
ncbi:putative secreted protein (Por secretion system target) [Flavobacteriaceae bacterium MAR_2010_72]|nr:putative secreted protein (Por secretion system target) [Flavobacteriaceae bacterium MAR_2010_72]